MNSIKKYIKVITKSVLSLCLATFYWGCEQGLYSYQNSEIDLKIEEIQSGQLLNGEGQLILNQNKLFQIRSKLIKYWNERDNINAVNYNIRSLSGDHNSPNLHSPQWNSGETFLIEKWWYVPTRVDVYKIYVCTYSGCRESEIFYQGELVK